MCIKIWLFKYIYEGCPESKVWLVFKEIAAVTFIIEIIIYFPVAYSLLITSFT